MPMSLLKERTSSMISLVRVSRSEYSHDASSRSATKSMNAFTAKA